MKSSVILLGVLVGVLVIGWGIFEGMGGVYYSGHNIPAGVYRKIDKPIAIGRYVTFCPSNSPEFRDALQRGYIENGECPEGFAMQYLKVAAKARDSISINGNGITVNDTFLVNSKPLIQDARGLALPKRELERYALKPNEVLLISDSKDFAFDSRYFGVVDVEQIDSVITPLF